MSHCIVKCLYRKWFSIESSNSDYTNHKSCIVLPRGTSYYSICVIYITCYVLIIYYNLYTLYILDIIYFIYLDIYKILLKIPFQAPLPCSLQRTCAQLTDEELPHHKRHNIYFLSPSGTSPFQSTCSWVKGTRASLWAATCWCSTACPHALISSWYSTLKPDNWAQDYLWTHRFPLDQKSSDNFCNLVLGFFSLLNLLIMSSTTVPPAPVSPAPYTSPCSCHTLVCLTGDNGLIWSSMWIDSSYLLACVWKFLQIPRVIFYHTRAIRRRRIDFWQLSLIKSLTARWYRTHREKEKA